MAWDMSAGEGGGGGGGSSQSISSRFPSTMPPFWPTSTWEETNHLCKNAETKAGIVERMAASEGVRDAFSMTVMARMFAEGAGDRRAWMSWSSGASVRIWVNETGWRSFMERLARMAGSCWYCLSMVVSLGRKRGMRGGMFASV